MERILTIGLSGPGVAASQFPAADLFGMFKPIEAAVQAIIAADGAGAPHAANSAANGIDRAGEDAQFSWWITARDGDIGEAQLTLYPPGWPARDALSGQPDPLQRLVDGIDAREPALPSQAIAALAEIAAAIPTERDVVRMRCDWTIVSFGRDWARPPKAAPPKRLHGWLWGVDSARGEARLQAQREDARTPFAATLRFEQTLASTAERFERSRVCLPLFETEEPRGTLPTFHAQAIEQHPCRHIPPDAKLFRWPTADEQIQDPNVDEFIDAAYQARRGDD